MKKIKVVVSGIVNEVFIGNDIEVEAFLNKIKKYQLSQLDEATLKEYKTFPVCPKTDQMHLYNERVKKNDFIDKTKFREKTSKFGLKIKISPCINNEFF